MQRDGETLQCGNIKGRPGGERRLEKAEKQAIKREERHPRTCEPRLLPPRQGSCDSLLQCLFPRQERRGPPIPRQMKDGKVINGGGGLAPAGRKSDWQTKRKDGGAAVKRAAFDRLNAMGEA